MELFAEDELEVDRLFAAASSQFEQAYIQYQQGF